MNLSGIPAQSCAPTGGTDYKLTAKSSSTAETDRGCVLGGKRNALLLLLLHLLWIKLADWPQWTQQISMEALWIALLWSLIRAALDHTVISKSA